MATHGWTYVIRGDLFTFAKLDLGQFDGVVGDFLQHVGNAV